VRHHSRHKAVAVTVARLNASLRAPVVANRLACQLDAVLQGRIADERLGPYLLGQLLLGNHPVAMLKEVDEDLENFGLEPDGLIGAA
jgi:hypothetical protein